MKIIVIGAGIMGLSTAWACRRRNMDVAIHEQGPAPNPLGASVDEHRQMFRAAYDDDNICRINDAGYRAWDRLWQDLGARLFHSNDMLLLSRAPGDIGDASGPSLQRLGFEHERIEPAVLATRFPHVDFSGVRFGIVEPGGGTLYAGAIVSALAGFLRRAGVTIREHSRVVAIDPVAGEIIFDDARREHADRIVIAAGPWSTKLLPELRPRSAPSRRVLLYLEPPERYRGDWATSPGIVNGALGIYFVPPTGGTGLKVGFHRDGAEGDPDAARQVPGSEAAGLLARAGALLSGGGEYRIARTHACYYQMSMDERFIVEQADGVWRLTGFSGHGFALGPYIGCKVAQALNGEIEADAVTRLMRGETVSTGVRESL